MFLGTDSGFRVYALGMFGCGIYEFRCSSGKKGMCEIVNGEGGAAQGLEG